MSSLSRGGRHDGVTRYAPPGNHAGDGLVTVPAVELTMQCFAESETLTPQAPLPKPAEAKPPRAADAGQPADSATRPPLE